MEVSRQRKRGRVGISMRQMWGRLQGFAGILTSLLSTVWHFAPFSRTVHPSVSFLPNVLCIGWPTLNRRYTHTLDVEKLYNVQNIQNIQNKLNSTIAYNPTQWGKKAENRAVSSLLLQPKTPFAFLSTFSAEICNNLTFDKYLNLKVGI